MTNIRLEGGKEIDLLAINPISEDKYHVECRIATSPSFKLRLEDTYTSKGRPHRRGVDFFFREKFNHPIVLDFVFPIFHGKDYTKILVVWDVQDKSVLEDAKKKFGIEVWLLPHLLRELMSLYGSVGSRDDILRTVELMGLTDKWFLKK